MRNFSSNTGGFSRLVAIALLATAAMVRAETQSTVSLTAPQLFSGYSGTFSVAQTTGAIAVAAGNIDYTYSGVMKYAMTSASGRYDGFTGQNRYGISFGPFQLFQSFLTPNFFTLVSASRICPNAQDYNWLTIRYRTPNVATNPMNASSTGFYAGGNLTYDPAGADLITGNNFFNLVGPTLDSTVYGYDAFNSCSSGVQKAVSSTATRPLDTNGTYYFGDNNFFYISSGGNPIVTVGVSEENLSIGSMATMGNNVFTGLFTRFETSSAQTRKNIYMYANAAGTTYTIYEATDLSDPSQRTSVGTLTCTSLNSPTAGFCSGTLALTGVAGSGKAVCLLSSLTPEKMIACSAQAANDTWLPISIIARVPSKAVISVTASTTAASVANPGDYQDITMTVKNLTGKSISSIGDAGGGLHITAPFTNTGSYMGSGNGGPCDNKLKGYETCTVTVRYTCSAVGTSKQVFRVAYNDGYFGTVNATVPVVGTCGLVSLALTPSAASFPSGSTVQYTATATYSNASTQDVTQAVQWSTSASSVATVGFEGTATFVGLGSVNIGASLAGVSGSKAVTANVGANIETIGQASASEVGGAITGLNGPRKVLVVGTRLILSDTVNNRVLIWNTLPASSSATPDLVLGQPDFDSTTANYSGAVAADTLSAPEGLASDGTSLWVADTGNHRVLIWNTIPTATAQDADLVLGQSSLTANTANSGGRSSSSLNGPRFVAVDNGKLFVTDTGNNRVLIWNTLPTSNKQAASLVQGQPAFNAATANNGGISASTMNSPRGLTVVGTKLFVCDDNNNRVLVWNTVPTANQTPADFVLGQPDFVTATANTGGRSASTFNTPNDVSSNGTVLFIVDYGNHRVLKWNAIPTTTAAAANVVLGQTDMSSATANSGGISASTLNAPTSVFVDNQRTMVTENSNNRMLYWTATPTANKAAANIVLGQPNFTSNLPNTAGLPTASLLSRNEGIFNDGTHLIVSDTVNNRVLIWNSIPTSNGQAADIVLGQPDMVSNTANNGGRSGSTLNAPRGVYSTGTKLAVADYGNHRVLIWSTFPTSNGQAANFTLGQNNLTAATSNQGGRSATSLSGPIAVFYDGTTFFVADYGNSRVLMYNGFPAANRPTATYVLGQPDFATGGANSSGLAANTLSSPRSIWSNGTKLFVSDYGNHRVLGWNTMPSANQTAANFALGQPDLVSNSANNGGRTAHSFNGPYSVNSDGTRLFVADYSNNRVLVWDALPTTTQADASRVIGQQAFTTNTANNGGISARSLWGPTGVYADGTRAWINDYSNYRVLVSPLNAQLSISSGPTYDYGDVVLTQASDKTFTITNSGFTPATGVAAGTPALSAPFSFIGGSYPGTSGTCGASISGNSSCTIRVRFNPSAEAAQFEQVVRVTYSDGVQTKTAVVGAKGRGISQASLTFTDGASYGYGTKSVGTNTDHTFTVSNASGVTAAMITPGTALGSQYTLKGGQFPGTGGTCGTVLATGSTCTVIVRFSPTSTGLKSDTLRLNYNNGNSTQTLSINLTGTGS